MSIVGAVIMIGCLAGISVMLSTKEERAAARERLKPAERIVGVITAAVVMLWIFWPSAS